MLRKFAVLATVVVSAVALVAVAAGAASTYRFKGSSGTPVRQGIFGENFELDGSTTLTSGPVQNTCNAHISGQVKANKTSAALSAAAVGHTFSSCSLAPTYAANTWSLTVNQGQTTATKNGSVKGVDVLLDLGGGNLCEFRGNLKVVFTNGSPSTVTLPGGTPDTLALYTGSGTFTTNAGACPPGGTATGSMTVSAASNPTNNIIIG